MKNMFDVLPAKIKGGWAETSVDIEKNLIAGLANLTRSGAFKEMLRAELQALSHAPERAYSNARAAGNATKAAFAYDYANAVAKFSGNNSSAVTTSMLAQQQKETVGRAVFKVLAVPRDLGEEREREREEVLGFFLLLSSRAHKKKGQPYQD